LTSWTSARAAQLYHGTKEGRRPRLKTSEQVIAELDAFRRAGLRARWREPHILFVYSLKVATHYHYAAIARALAEAEQGGDMPNAGRSFSGVKRKVEARAAA
jgi:hypothetical protein